MSFLDWLTTSSIDPEKTSLTVKSMLGYLVPVVVIVSQIIGHPLVQQDLESAVIYISAGVTALLQLYGLGRKLYFTFKK